MEADENAVMQLLLHTPPTTMYGPVYKEAAQTWNLMTPRLGAALNAWNQGQTRTIASLVTPQDATTLTNDLTAEGLHAPRPQPGLPALPQGGTTLQAMAWRNGGFWRTTSRLAGIASFKSWRMERPRRRR